MERELTFFAAALAALRAARAASERQ